MNSPPTGKDLCVSLPVRPSGKPAIAFLFKLIALLQFSGTVPMIGVNAYAKWLVK